MCLITGTWIYIDKMKLWKENATIPKEKQQKNAFLCSMAHKQHIYSFFYDAIGGNWAYVFLDWVWNMLMHLDFIWNWMVYMDRHWLLDWYMDWHMDLLINSKQIKYEYENDNFYLM